MRPKYLLSGLTVLALAAAACSSGGGVHVTTTTAPNADLADLHTFRVRSHSVSTARVAWFAATGEFPLRGRIRHTCGSVSCVRSQHLVWELGRTSERELLATSDGYVSVACIGGASLPNAIGAEYRRAS